MKKCLLLIVICAALFSCKEEELPMVTVEVAPDSTLLPEIARLGTEPMFDTILYRTKLKQDTLFSDTTSLFTDTIRYHDKNLDIDTFRVDTFVLDTFYLDSIRVYANVSYPGTDPKGPTIHECGFYVNGAYYVARQSDTTSVEGIYGLFSSVVPAYTKDTLHVSACVKNPFGVIESHVYVFNVSDLDPR